MPPPLIALSFCAALQSLALVVDEGYCHHKRGLPLWERRGHAIDTFFFALPFLAMGMNASDTAIAGFSLLSCLIILKDEWVHAGRIDGFESFLHAFLFLIHPLTLLSAYWVKSSTSFGHWLFWVGVSLWVIALAQFTYWHKWGPR